jgi:hypothetical protein
MAFPPPSDAWLFATIEVRVDWSAGGALGMRLSKADNMVVELAPSGLAERSGLAVGDTIVDIDDGLITDFHFEAGPHENTMVCSARAAVRDASDAIDRSRPEHTFRVLRPLGPPPGAAAAPSLQPMNHATPAHAQPPSQAPISNQPLQPQPIDPNPLTHYPWATSFKTADGAIKNRYNMPNGTSLPPVAQPQVSLTASQRKAAFATSMSDSSATTPSRRYIVH